VASWRLRECCRENELDEQATFVAWWRKPYALTHAKPRHARFETTRGYVREADAFRDNAAGYLGL
jgi:hypothetical protein